MISVIDDKAEGLKLQTEHPHGDALEVLLRAMADAPNDAEIPFRAGCVAHEMGRNEEAVTLLQKCLSIDPLHAKALVELGTVMDWELYRHDAAEKCYRLAMKMATNDHKPYFHLGVEMMYRGNFTEARTLIAQAITMAPSDPTLYWALAQIEYEMGNTDKSFAILENLLASHGKTPEILRQESHMLLRSGKFIEGFKQYRFRPVAKGEDRFPLQGRPLAVGDSIRGKTILVIDEQGVGDTLNFLRYIHLLKEGGARVILLVNDAQLELLLARNDVADTIIHREKFHELQERIDCSIYLMDLPWFFGTSLETVPACEPRLKVSPEKEQAFAHRLTKTESLFVGVVWRGSRFHLNDRRRSISGDMIEELFDIPSVKFVSLQKGEDEYRFKGNPMVDVWAGDLSDFDDTAAAVKALDLIVSVDTSVAHLAGVLHKDVWLLLPYASEWRWLENREDSVWYPTMRIFRQEVLGEWSGVLDRVKRELIQRTHDKRSVRLHST
jgi:tetratricopeptide (TPR) repeat protein